MKIQMLLLMLFVSAVAVAQEQIVLPSSFDENQMIVRVRDENGNFQPQYQPQAPQAAKFVPSQPQPQTQVPEPAPVVQEEPVKEVPAQQEAKPVRRFRAIQRDYSLPKTTFDTATLAGVSGAPSTFETQTMQQAVEDFRRESITGFEECTDDNPDCKVYETDEKGEVIFK